MKFTGETNPTATLTVTGSNLRSSHRSTIRARKRRPRLTLQRRSGIPGERRSRPETPLLKWKVENQSGERRGEVEDDEYEDDSNKKGNQWPSQERRRCVRSDTVREVGAGMWRSQILDAVSSGGDKRCRDGLGFKGCGGPEGHLGSLFLYHHDHRHVDLQSNKLTRSGFLRKHETSVPLPHSAMEGATKWDPIYLDARDDSRQVYSNVNASSSASSIELKLEEARARIEDLEGEKRSQKKKLEQFLRKVSEERASWRSKEHEKVRAIIDDMKADMTREKKTRQRLEIVNQKLVNELADSKLAVKRYIHDYEKEKKGRELIEEVCEELAKEIEDDKAEIETLKSESMNLRDEVDNERRILQMAEVWREERVQMKLIDAKVTLEDKYSQMNKLVEDLEAFLRSRNGATSVKEMRDAESLKQTVAAVNYNIEEIKEFTYEPTNPDDIFTLFEEMNLSEAQEHCVSNVATVSPDVDLVNKGRHSNAFTDQNGEFEEEEGDSGWETVSHPEEDRSCCSPDESIPCISNQHHRDSNASMNGTVFEKTPLREIKEVCSVPRRESKKISSSMAKLWSSLEGINGRVSNARKSNVGMVSPERGIGKGGFRSSDLAGQWISSPNSGSADNVNRPGGRKGCIEWPRGANKNSFKTNKLVERQKVQLKHVLEHNS